MEADSNTSDLTSDFHQETRKLVGERIRQLWVESGEQQDEFVKALGITTVTLSNYMGGKRKPDSEFLFALKRKLNICIDWLLTGEGPMRPGEAPQALELQANAPETPPKAAGACPRCAKLEEKLERVEEERRELSAENRQLWKENAGLREKNARLERLEDEQRDETPFKGAA